MKEIGILIVCREMECSKLQLIGLKEHSSNIKHMERAFIHQMSTITQEIMRMVNEMGKESMKGNMKIMRELFLMIKSMDKGFWLERAIQIFTMLENL
jgi:hypothetical protein